MCVCGGGGGGGGVKVDKKIRVLGGSLYKILKLLKRGMYSFNLFIYLFMYLFINSCIYLLLLLGGGLFEGILQPGRGGSCCPCSTVAHRYNRPLPTINSSA